MVPYQVIITANGSGERMKSITDGPKFSLFYKGKRILEHLIDVFPTAKVLTHYDIPYIDQGRIIKCEPTNSRRETLEFIQDMENVLIVDCDIIPDTLKSLKHSPPEDVTFWKYGDNTRTEAIPNGLYFLKSVKDRLEAMKDGEIGFIKFNEDCYWDSLHLGTIDEYYNAVLGD